MLTTEELEAEHHDLDRVLAALPRDLEMAGDACRLIERHLGREEHLVLPVWLRSYGTRPTPAPPTGLAAAA